jgi:hypothetical protein
MRPRDLTEAKFRQYPPLGRQLALQHLALLRRLPPVLDAVLLRGLQEYDTCFPVERADTEARLAYLAALSPGSLDELTQDFAKLTISPELADEDWVSSPRKFEEDLSAHLWASHQIDAFHAMSEKFVHAVANAEPAQKSSLPRLSVVALAPELHKEGYTLFRKLLPHGTLFSQADASNGMEVALQRLVLRARKSPVAYGHWYIDGGEPLPCSSDVVSCLSWAGTEPVRAAVLHEIESVITSGSAGPEMLRSIMAGWKQREQGSIPGDPVFNAFVQSVYGEGAGTQIFSTTFVQWSMRELLRRAQPVTLMARFGPRQRQSSMNEMFAEAAREMDFAGSAVDADFAAYYTWINMQRLPGAENASFVAYSLRDQRAVVIGPGFPRGTESPTPVSMEKLLNMIAEG